MAFIYQETLMSQFILFVRFQKTRSILLFFCWCCWCYALFHFQFRMLLSCKFTYTQLRVPHAECRFSSLFFWQRFIAYHLSIYRVYTYMHAANEQGKIKSNSSCKSVVNERFNKGWGKVFAMLAAPFPIMNGWIGWVVRTESEYETRITIIRTCAVVFFFIWKVA